MVPDKTVPDKMVPIVKMEKNGPGEFKSLPLDLLTKMFWNVQKTGVFITFTKVGFSLFYTHQILHYAN